MRVNKLGLELVGESISLNYSIGSSVDESAVSDELTCIANVCVRARMFVCVRVRERAYVRQAVHVCVRACVRVRARARARAS